MIREDRYFVEEMAEETIVFDRSNGRCHCLNDTAARVWRLTEGEGLSKAEVVARLAEEAGSDVDDSVVDLALARLRSAGILSVTTTAKRPGPSRRDLMRRAAIVGGLIAVPTVVSIVAPLPASAQSMQCSDVNPNEDQCTNHDGGCPEGQQCVQSGNDCVCQA